MNPTNQVSYDGFNFADNGIVLTNIGHLVIAPRRNQLETLANRNGSVLVQSQLGTKPIVLEGYYIGATAVSAQIMYDTLAQVLNRQERLLIVPHSGSTRKYTATPENIVIQEPDGLNRLTFSLEFVVPTGSSYSDASTSLVNSVVTTASSTIPLTVLGSVVTRPMITITFTTVTGGIGKTVTIRNARDFIGLTFTRNFVSGDVIIIDSDKFQIYVNGVLTEPVGRLPTWQPGSGSLFYSDTFTTRSVSILATYMSKHI